MDFLKAIFGLVLLLAGLWLLIPGFVVSGYTSGAWLQDFLVLLRGLIPPFLVFLGFILVWIEAEDMKMSKPRKRKR